ncbi:MULTISPECIES: hypothetical protein [Streptomyces]|nr:hypothetical protein [Streptomyces virginiae]
MQVQIPTPPPEEFVFWRLMPSRLPSRIHAARQGAVHETQAVEMTEVDVVSPLSDLVDGQS